MSNEVKKEVIEVNGKKLVFPNPTEDQIPFRIMRKIRGLKGSNRDQEALMSIMEFFLTENELDEWDNLSGADMKRAFEALEKVDFLIA